MPWPPWHLPQHDISGSNNMVGTYEKTTAFDDQASCHDPTKHAHYTYPKRIFLLVEITQSKDK
jgi:hypothetical protein